jgi:hypothetical protein
LICQRHYVHCGSRGCEDGKEANGLIGDLKETTARRSEMKKGEEEEEEEED